MRTPLTILGMSLLVTFGCSKKQTGYATYEAPDSSYDTYTAESETYDPGVMEVADTYEEVAWSNSNTTVTDTEVVSTVVQPASYSQASGNTVHVVQPKDTLYGLARNYYSDPRQWKRIFQANSAQIRDPDKIFVGMELVIP